MFNFKKVNLGEEAQKLYEMDVAAFNRPFDLPSRSVEETKSYLEGCEIEVAYEGSDAVGLFAYKTSLGKVEVKQLLVVPAYQKKGYGSHILRHLLARVKGTRVWLVTHPQNTAAIILYLRQGFRISGWKENYYGDGQPRLLLERG